MSAQHHRAVRNDDASRFDQSLRKRFDNVEIKAFLLPLPNQVVSQNI